MNEKHVTSLELSKALFEAGITKDFESEFYWGKYTDETYPALLLSELLELMPPVIHESFTYNLTLTRREGKEWVSAYISSNQCYLTPRISKSAAIEALSSLASYLLREGKFNNNAK